MDKPYYRLLPYTFYIHALSTYNMPSMPMLINGYIDIFIVVVIFRIIPTNPKPICNVYAFTFIYENKDWSNKLILKSQTRFNQNKNKKSYWITKKHKPIFRQETLGPTFLA